MPLAKVTDGALGKKKVEEPIPLNLKGDNAPRAGYKTTPKGP
eukprot:CAMPEP_0172536764 /NCGR_PEP_ID=MMETSP1067-20121228/8487_1 /TAXON_ID=265564 ORGANISM="Thalassiosira punctigera, Strain Tpunct2005C2" /NCGR_SAMPLE_ID=MMETSP1067 /ASSEMBLY_ACC=CAM_ASM_000444 /LENGTH=41 /DNA_ID= /DNA_START= /DNA_END= /DNA_ORIENTATION=